MNNNMQNMMGGQGPPQNQAQGGVFRSQVMMILQKAQHTAQPGSWQAAMPPGERAGNVQQLYAVTPH